MKPPKPEPAAHRLHALLTRLPDAWRPPPRHAPPAAVLRSSPESPQAEEAEGVRLSPPLPAARAIALVGVLAALIAAGYLWAARPRPEPARPATVAGAAAPTTAPAVPPAASPTPSLVVHVAGKVRRPGVVTLPPGARVTDAISAAGGLRPGARTGTLNLARKVVDGEQIVAGARQPAAQPPGVPVPSQPAAGGTAPGTPLDLNAATAEQFDQLPGVGPVLAQRIVEYRTQHGGFRSVDELQQVNGIGDRRFAELKGLVRV